MSELFEKCYKSYLFCKQMLKDRNILNQMIDIVFIYSNNHDLNFSYEQDYEDLLNTYEKYDKLYVENEENNRAIYNYFRSVINNSASETMGLFINKKTFKKLEKLKNSLTRTRTMGD